MASLRKSEKTFLMSAAANQWQWPRIAIDSPQESIVIQKSLGRAALVAVLCAALATPARADKLQSDADHIIIGIVVVVAAIVVVTIILVKHEAKKTGRLPDA
jgi:hypothetical protein